MNKRITTDTLHNLRTFSFVARVEGAQWGLTAEYSGDRLARITFDTQYPIPNNRYSAVTQYVPLYASYIDNVRREYQQLEILELKPDESQAEEK